MAMSKETPHNEGRDALEECVRRQLAEIEVIYSTVPVGLCVFDRQGRYIRVNERLAEINGLPEADHIGRTIREVVPDLADQAEAILLRVMEKCEPVRDVEVTGTTLASKGARRTWLEHWLPLKDDSGRVIGVNVVAEDITRRKQTVENLEQQVHERTSALEMLRDVASMANRAQDVEEALEYCLRRVAEHNGWNFGHAFLLAADDPGLLLPAYAWYTAGAERFQAFRDLTLRTPLRRGQGLPGTVLESGKPQWSTEIRAELSARRVDLAEDLGLATAAAFPVMVEQRVVGVLEFFSDKTIEPGAEMLESMASVGMQLGRVIERKAFQDRLLTLAEEEHRRIGQELHDDVGQELTGLALKAETLAEMLGDDESPAGSLAGEIVVSIDRTRKKTRALSRGLVPMEVDAPGLEDALEGLALRIGEGKTVSCTFRRHNHGRVADSRTATQLYRIAQEAVANALGHPQTTAVDITLRDGEESTILQIGDDGPGLPPETERGAGLGLQIMRHRAGLIGGKLMVESLPSGGTRVTCRLPRYKQ
jgi:PAS domain S-box-containing protein